MDITKNALWIFGDSFCQEDARWTGYLGKYFESKYSRNQSKIRWYNYAEGSSDTQTILDNWIRILPYMKEDDVIVVCLSDISRARFPLKMQNIVTLPPRENPHQGPIINSYFYPAPAGWNPDNPLVPSHEQIDNPFKSTQELRDYSWNTNIMLNTKAYDNSKIDIVEALYKITPCKKKFVYTWIDGNKLNSENIHSKKWITENVLDGNWETLHDSWISSGGKIGKKGDAHLSDLCEKMMADYFIKEFEL